jgi:aldehyde dehydrogenase (NAD+)
MIRDVYPYFLANEAVFANTDLEITDKYTGQVAARMAQADAKTIDAAIDAAVRSQHAFAEFRPYQRKAVLDHCVKRFRERFEEMAYALCIEAGKPIKDARGEVTRLIDTFEVAAEEAVRIDGEVMNLEISARAKGYRGFWKRVPIGPCSLISPFNFPLNLAAHKIAPAIAAGCPFVMKPASRTPIGAIIIGEVLAETDLPKGSFSILPCHRDGADLFTTDERFKLLSFTGSPSVGWDLKARAGKKKVVLELGGNAACVVDADQGHRLDHIAERIVFGAYYQSGQSCISVQRIYIHASLYEALRAKLVERVSALIHGDPRQEDTFIGPMISEGEAKRLHGWVERARASGANILTGGSREGAMLRATLIENAGPELEVSCMEAFGPVAVIAPFENFEEVLGRINDSTFGLQAGIFTDSMSRAMRAWDVLEVGGVVIGDVPSWRVDNMPYGGVKDSGLGREGVRYAIEDMTEIRLLVVKDP